MCICVIENALLPLNLLQIAANGTNIFAAKGKVWMEFICLHHYSQYTVPPSCLYCCCYCCCHLCCASNARYFALSKTSPGPAACLAWLGWLLVVPVCITIINSAFSFKLFTFCATFFSFFFAFKTDDVSVEFAFELAGLQRCQMKSVSRTEFFWVSCWLSLTSCLTAETWILNNAVGFFPAS